MDLQPSAPYASASSFPSPSHIQMSTNPLQAFEKLQDFCQSGPTSPSTNAFSKFPFPTFRSSPTKSAIGVDVTPDLFPSSNAASTWGGTAAHQRVRSSTGTYFSPNKITYGCAGNVGGTDTPCFPSPPTASSSTLQGILQRCGLGNSIGFDQQQKKNQLDAPARPAISSRITQKIRNLDEILRNLDHYSLSKRFTMAARKEMTDPLSKKQHQWSEPEIPTMRDMVSEQLRSTADHSSGTLGGSVIPDGITHINKSISRMEFKAQMEKLTGIIDVRWPDSRRIERVDSADIETLAGAQHMADPSSARNGQEQRQAKEELPPQPASMNATNSSVISTNFLEMLRNVAGLEHHFAKRGRPKQTKPKGFLARERLWVQRPAGKKMAAMLQKQFRQHAASINQRLDKTDLAIKSIRRRRREALFMEGNYSGQERKVSRVTHSSSNILAGSLDNRDFSSTGSEKNLAESKQPTIAEKCMEACEALSRSIQHIQDQLCTLQSDSQHMGHSLETSQKQSSEQSMEIELCWTAINHLCIDNETFRKELEVYQSSLQQQQLPHGPASAYHEELQVCWPGPQLPPPCVLISTTEVENEDQTNNCQGWKLVTQMG